MRTRRSFLAETTAASLLMPASLSWAREPPNLAITRRATGIQIRSVVRREETILRHGGEGDNWHMSWAADDRQYVALCDGYGWQREPKLVYNSRLHAISGGPEKPLFEDVAGYPLLPLSVSGDRPWYYGFGTLALDGHIYQYLSTAGNEKEGITPNSWFQGVKLIYSPDNGRTWHNQNGSTPVVWESWGKRSRENMIFFREPQDAFSVISILQMGRNYESNRDGYVYGYAPNGATEGTANELVLFRVPRARLLDRAAYEFFAGLTTEGGARWAGDVRVRTPVHTFPKGWVPTHPHSWVPSVVYNAPLKLFLMANSAFGVGPKGEFGAKPSYLGFWTAPNPWGPWTQIHEETAWLPGGDARALCYEAQIAPKWMAPDGKSFWLVWSDFQNTSEFGKLLAEAAKSRTDEEFARLAPSWRAYRPYYAFNVQRVDLSIV